MLNQSQRAMIPSTKVERRALPACRNGAGAFARGDPSAPQLLVLPAMMTNRSIVLLLITAAATPAFPSLARAQTPKPNAAQTALIAEGRRLVENVGLCTDCHAPRLPTGEFDRTRWLQGSALPFEPTVEMPWSAVAPPIAGLPGYTEEQAVRFFTTGERPNGVPVRPPMPAFRLSAAEAKAVVAYLKSLAQS
jgi:mono/diheme cytochrome c family protein